MTATFSALAGAFIGRARAAPGAARSATTSRNRSMAEASAGPCLPTGPTMKLCIAAGTVNLSKSTASECEGESARPEVSHTSGFRPVRRFSQIDETVLAGRLTRSRGPLSLGFRVGSLRTVRGFRRIGRGAIGDGPIAFGDRIGRGRAKNMDHVCHPPGEPTASSLPLTTRLGEEWPIAPDCLVRVWPPCRRVSRNQE